MKAKNPATYRKARHKRIRKKVKGTGAKPRLSVFISNKFIYVQVIDDVAQSSLASASTIPEKVPGSKNNSYKSIAHATALGCLIANRCLDIGISSAVFDRGGYKFHGRIKALADAARSTGLKF